MRQEAARIVAERKRLGLQGLVSGLQSVIINTEPQMQKAASEELLRYSGLEFQSAFQDTDYRTCVLKVPRALKFRLADFLIRSRRKGENPFQEINIAPRSRHRAILEFLRLTNYEFDFAIYVKSFNSITSVARLSSLDFAMVFTSGIAHYVSDEVSGPTEKFIHNYGTRVHHIAFQTDEIEETYRALVNDGMKFLIELVVSPEEGLKQTFTEPSKNTLLVMEYIHRYGDFDGFFDRLRYMLAGGLAVRIAFM